MDISGVGRHILHHEIVERKISTLAVPDPTTIPKLSNDHFPHGQCSRFVRTNIGDAAKGFNGIETSDNRIPSGHMSNPLGHRDRHNSNQRFRDDCQRKGNRI
jgi:hypothetical protein